MKKKGFLFLVLLALLCCTNVIAKEKIIKYGKYANYSGEVSGRIPSGQGTFTIIMTNVTPQSLTLNGNFSDLNVNDGEIAFYLIVIYNMLLYSDLL